jgi:ferredoxin--NADP+ reductase
MSTPPTKLHAVTLTRHDEISPGVFVIGYKREHPFIPGQAVKLGIDGEHPPRIYSICSGPDDTELQVLFNIKEDGFLTPRLAKLKIGDTLLASEPYGTFLGTEEPAVWIATGTGIAPFRSMVRAGMVDGKTLVHGVRTPDQFYFSHELEEALGDDYRKCCSRANGADAFDGRVTKYLEDQPDLPSDIPYYICGQAIMAVEVRDILIAKGIPFSNIQTEIYF